MKAWILGSGGWIPTERRETLCVLVRTRRHGLLLDAGTGLQRLLSTPELLDGVQTLDIALTHFHLDHVCGLFNDHRSAGGHEFNSAFCAEGP
jgi:ribonuclease BN (tRNA processing enzyme)